MHESTELNSHVTTEGSAITKGKLSELIDMMQITSAENTGTIPHLDKMIDFVSYDNGNWTAPWQEAQFDGRRSRYINFQNIANQLPKKGATQIMSKAILISTSMNRVKQLAAKNTRQENLLIISVASSPTIENGPHDNQLELLRDTRNVRNKVN